MSVLVYSCFTDAKKSGVLRVYLSITKSVQVAVGFMTEDLVQTVALCCKCHLGFKQRMHKGCKFVC